MISKSVFVAILFFTGYMGTHAAKRPLQDDRRFKRFLMNGTPASAGEYPHMVALTLGPDPPSFLCGGSLISQRTVLTTAHCIDEAYYDGSLYKTLSVTVGTTIWYSDGHNYSVERNISHPQFVKSSFLNDIGLIITTADVQLSPQVKTIALSYDYIPGDIETKVAGWGSRGADESTSNYLRVLTSKTISGEKCVQDMKNFTEASNTSVRPIEPLLEICTFTAVGLGTCHGDAGSGLIRSSDRRQIGIVSWGLPCARGAPDVYTRISSHADWLQKNIV